MAWDDLNDNGVSDLVEDELLKMEMRGLDAGPRNPEPNYTHSRFEKSTPTSIGVRGLKFGWIKDSIKYSSKKGKVAMIIAAVVLASVTAIGMAIAFLLY